MPAEPAHLRTVGRMVLLAGLVGVVAGLGAVAFQFLSHLVLKYGLEFFAGAPACLRCDVHGVKSYAETVPLAAASV